MRSIRLIVLAVGLLAAACSSGGESSNPDPTDTTASGTTANGATSGATASEVPVPDPIKGCVPRCNRPGLSSPGPLPAGPYESVWFFGGEMVVTLDEQWNSDEDSTGELAFRRDQMPDDVLMFWEDVYPIDSEGARIRGVPMTVDGLLEWIRNEPRLEMTEPHPGRIGDLPATVVDVAISEDAKNEVGGGCPSRVCVALLGYPQWEGPFGIADTEVPRFYLSDVTYGGEQHLFLAVLVIDDPATTEAFQAHVEDLIATVQVPATPA